MDDARELQYGVGFETGEADSSIDQLTQKVDALEQRLGAVEMGARSMGAGAVSACNAGADSASRFGDSIDDATDAMEGMAAGTRTAADTAAQFGHGLDSAGDDADALRAKIRETAESADDLGDAFRQTMADGMEAGQSIAKSFGTGITGALDFSRNKVKTFINDAVKGAKNIQQQLQHPIKTIRTGLVTALRGATEAAGETGDAAEDTADDLDDMGDEGEAAAGKVSKALDGLVKKFIGFQAIKKGIDLLKQFGEAAIGAYSATETTAKQFGALFSDEAAAWVNNYADAVHRSTAEVQGFMVENQAMYKGMGITSDAAEMLSEITTSLGYDLGNAFSMSDAEAMGLIQSAVQGDTDALTAYGFALDETALKQSAAALGLGDNIDALDDAAMAQVRLNAILEQSDAIQRAAIEQTDGLTNSTKNLNGVWQNFMTSAGSKFAPAVESIVDAIVDNWPTLEPMLLSFVDVLADGLSSVAPTLIELGQNLIPTLTSVISTLVSAAGPLLEIFADLAGAILPPLVEIIDNLAATVLPPFLDILNVLNTDVIQPLMPVIQEVAGALLPVLGEAFSVVGGIVSEVAGSVIPPLVEVLQAVISALGPIIDLAMNILEAILPAITPLISALGDLLSGVIVPVIEALSPAISVVADLLGTVVGWIADLIGWVSEGVGKVVNFFASIFGGAKESSDAVDDLTHSVSGLDDATSEETTLAVDTSQYSKDVTTATTQAQQAMSDAATAARDISNENYGLMADDAETAYARMTLDAESAWERMTRAAADGARSIVQSFASIATAAQSVSNANISVTGVSIPSHASGTPSFEGGWTRMNEEGGELAFLPQGTAIIPADKTDEIINNSTSNSSSVEYVDSSSFAPQISITLGGDSSVVDEETIAERVRAEIEKFWREKKEEEAHNRALQGAYARA